MQYVMIEGNFAYATNAHVAVAYNISNYIKDEQLQKLNGHAIHKDFWKEICAAPLFMLKGDLIMVQNGSDTKYYTYKKLDEYPVVKEVIRSAINGHAPVSIVCIKSKLHDMITKIMGFDGLEATAYLRKDEKETSPYYTANTKAIAIMSPYLPDGTPAELNALARSVAEEF